MKDLNFPAWIDSEYFREILAKKHKNTSLKVCDVRIEPCCAAGDGFLSTLLRAHVEFEHNSEQKLETFVLKLSGTCEFANTKIGVNGFDVQNKEMLFLELIAPQIEKQLMKIDEHENLIPEVIAVDRRKETIIFEDLKSKDFQMVDRMTGLDEAHTLLALKKLAKFHAASLIIHQKHPKAFELFDTGMFSRKIDGFNDAFVSIYEILIEEIEKWDECDEYVEKLKKLQPSLIEAALICFDNDQSDLLVLNHGDLWTNNLMFSYGDNDEVTEGILIDFQFCHWASPALDLFHLLYTSLSDELFNQEEIDALCQSYYYELKELLLKLDYGLSTFPTLHEFQIQAAKKLFYGLLYTFVVFPIMTSNDVDNNFISHHSRDERSTNFKRRVLKGKRFQETMKRMLPVFDRKGLLDLDFTRKP